jgi:hypothetical protein
VSSGASRLVSALTAGFSIILLAFMLFLAIMLYSGLRIVFRPENQPFWGWNERVLESTMETRNWMLSRAHYVFR